MSTWYVRPDTSHSGTRDGTSYATAWGGWSSITWGVGGVVGGDTLYVCGPHSYATAITIGAHGGSSLATRCTINGAYEADPGSLTFTTNGDFLQNDRAWTRVTGLTINAAETGASNNNCIFVTDTATNCKYDNNVLNGSQTASVLSMWGANGQDHVNVEISDNEINGGGGTSGGAINWFVSGTGDASSMTGLSILRNAIRNVVSNNDQVINLRWENDTNVANAITNLTIDGNTFTNCKGIGIRAGGDYTVVGVSAGLVIRDNVFRDFALADSGIGGAIFLKGFAPGSAGNEISGNEAYNITGAGGFIDLLYCSSIRSAFNYCDGIYTTSIDGNGMLFDLGCTGCSAIGNVFRNMPGLAGAANSGVGVMLLEGTGNVAYGNVVIGCKWGIHIGDVGAGQSGDVANNTMVDCADGAIYISTTADIASDIIRNNIFVGSGYSVYDRTAVAWSGEDYNYFHGFSSGTLNHTLGANSSTADPLLDASYRLTAASPCRGAGTYIRGLFDADGKQVLKNPPDIGAYQYHRERSRINIARALVQIERGGPRSEDRTIVRKARIR